MPDSRDIERRAYELYEARGRADGQDWEDWLRAERELRAAEGEERAGESESARRRRSEREEPSLAR